MPELSSVPRTDGRKLNRRVRHRRASFNDVKMSGSLRHSRARAERSEPYRVLCPQETRQEVETDNSDLPGKSANRVYRDRGGDNEGNGKRRRWQE